MQLRSGDVELFYEAQASGPPLVLLHPFPTNHRFWNSITPALAQRYRLIIPDVRGHGASGEGAGPATMQQHASDLLLLCDAEQIKTAIFFGVSIGGYILFEFWRRSRERVRAVILCDTRAQADTPEGRAMRLKAAADVETNGPDEYLDGMVPKLLGESTRRNRPDLVREARAMMGEMSAAGIAAVLRGMAERPDSVATLKSIDVPTLLLVGEQDTLTPPADAELMQRNIKGSRLVRIPGAGHYAPFEQTEAVLGEVRKFLGSLSR
jgi:pimeloyl-ACP methyl ester carboxylesterase